VSFTVVGSKRRRGRPTTVSTANTSRIPDIASFLQIPSTQCGSTQLANTQANSSLSSLGDEAMAETLDDETMAETSDDEAIADISEDA
jgi:hypothetical protein